MTEGRVVGVDVGGTSSRALAMELVDGTVTGRGTAAGGNPNSHPPELAAKRVAEAVRDALAPGGSGEVLGCMLGLAGESKFTDQAVADTFTVALRQVGVGCPISVLSDAEVAFASATAEPDGTVVVGGTGSVAARIVNHRKLSWVGGLGWLLGDEGSAYWIGREAVRTALRQLQAGAAPGPLSAAVLAEALPDVPADDSLLLSRLITAANSEPPIRLARFASLVSTYVATDPAAARIVGEAADLLAGQALMARSAGERTPVVLAGSVIGPDSPVGTSLRALLAERTPAEVLFAPDGAVGAAWLSALEVAGPDAPRPRTAA